MCLPRALCRRRRKSGINIPVVVRMEGTNVDEGKKILADSGLEPDQRSGS